MGRIYKDRVKENISLPKEAWLEANEKRGQKPIARFLGEIVCEHLGVGGIDAGADKARFQRDL